MGHAGSFFRFCDPEFQGASLVLSVGVKAVGDLSRAVGSWLLGVARSSLNVSLCSVSSGCASEKVVPNWGKCPRLGHAQVPP
jgi:hypothetical protein